MFSINRKWNNCGRVGFGGCELGVHLLQRERCAHEKESDIARSNSGLFAELCACFLLSPVLLHVCVVERTFLITSCVYSLSWHWGDVEDLRCIGVVWGRGIGTHDVEEGIPRAR